MEKKLEYGKWINSSNLVYGVKANEEGFKKLLEERKKPSTNKEYHEGDGVSIFNLYDETGCDGWWIGNQYNPDGIVLGSVLRDYNGIELDTEKEIDLEHIDLCIERYKEIDYYETLERINHALGYENKEMQLYLVPSLYFVNKNTIIEFAKRWPESYPQYIKMVEKDSWDVREI